MHATGSSWYKSNIMLCFEGPAEMDLCMILLESTTMSSDKIQLPTACIVYQTAQFTTIVCVCVCV